MESTATIEESKAYKNAQLFCVCHCYSDHHACNFVGAI
jgi:hypothetical protein